MSRFGAVAVVTVLASALTCAAMAEAPYKLPRPEEMEVAPENFRRSTVIDNKWSPMRPGMRWTHEGVSREDDGKIVPHRLVTTVTDLVKVLSGVPTVVTYTLDYSDGEVVEAELSFFAQDNSGTVWHFGEYPEEYEEGKFVKAPAWIHGLDGARFGIAMPAEPQLGMADFSEGWAPAVNWKDRGVVYQVNQKMVLAAGTFTDVLVIKESAAEERDAEQLEYYAPSVGTVATGWLGSDAKVTEDLSLVRFERINGEELRKVRRQALQLEVSAYKRSKTVYAKTTRSVVPGRTGPDPKRNRAE